MERFLFFSFLTTVFLGDCFLIWPQEGGNDTPLLKTTYCISLDTRFMRFCQKVMAQRQITPGKINVTGVVTFSRWLEKKSEKECDATAHSYVNAGFIFKIYINFSA